MVSLVRLLSPRTGGRVVLDVERRAEPRPEHFVRGVPIKELMRRTGLARNTIRTAMRSAAPPAFRLPERRSKLDPFKEEIHDLLRWDPKLPGVRVGVMIEPLDFDGGKLIVDDYPREVRPLSVKTRTHQRTCLSPGGDLPVGFMGALGARACRPRPAAPGMGRGGVPRLLACWCRCADLQQRCARRAVGDGALPVVTRGAGQAG